MAGSQWSGAHDQGQANISHTDSPKGHHRVRTLVPSVTCISGKTMEVSLQNEEGSPREGTTGNERPGHDATGILR